MSAMNRRHFLSSSGYAAIGTAAMGAAPPAASKSVSPNEKVIIGVMGLGGRGSWLANQFALRPDCVIAYLCDPRGSILEERAKAIAKVWGQKPKTSTDFRRMLEDREVDGIVNATPDHWHALGTILACQAGKDVYVEKPASHSLWEGRKMVEAARKYKRVVQLGTQNRSAPYCMHAKEYISSGKLGDVHLMRVLNMKTRGVIANRPDSTPPAGFDYNLWLGPAPEKPYNQKYVNNWNWFWDFSGGDIINDAIHQMDLARWVIGRTSPKSVIATGAIHHFKDGADTPDTQNVVYEFDGLTVQFDLTLWTPYIKKVPQELRDRDAFPNWPFYACRIELYGTKGLMMLGRHSGGWQVFSEDWKGEPFEYGRQANDEHIGNFIECIRTRNRPNADIEEGHLSTVLCHLGNISYRVGNRKLKFDGATERFIGDDEANALLKRTYRPPWVVPEQV